MSEKKNRNFKSGGCTEKKFVKLRQVGKPPFFLGESCKENRSFLSVQIMGKMKTYSSYKSGGRAENFLIEI
jgi:hypothetical protein